MKLEAFPTQTRVNQANKPVSKCFLISNVDALRSPPITPKKIIITSFPLENATLNSSYLLHKRLRRDYSRLLHNRKVRRTRRRAADTGAGQILQRHQHGRRPLLVRRRALVAGIIVELDLLALHAPRGDVLVQRGEECRPGRRAGAGDVYDGVAGRVEAVA